ncbi:hypothetical protein [Hyphomicrobium sp.]|uniref:hypothetical protein n=1 Tax=Hyphomicrobium sp. TaxID=82 RepID=UPI002E36DF38|nr:hypothetical protein [Hyphomicrobium sp.]HEX2842719.1 hypothetical protein [Hyphomicrobium sp.]
MKSTKLPSLADIGTLAPDHIATLRRYFAYSLLTLDLGLPYESWLEGHYIAFSAKHPSPTADSFMHFMHETYADVSLTTIPGPTLH